MKNGSTKYGKQKQQKLKVTEEKTTHANVKKITKRKLGKRIKQKKQRDQKKKRERGKRKKNDRGVTVTRRSRLLSRHSARLSRERVILRSIADRYHAGQTGYRAAVITTIDERKCMQRDVTRRIATPNLPLSLLSLPLLFSLSSLFLSLSILNLSSRVSQLQYYTIKLN